jgi:hypothetical protein
MTRLGVHRTLCVQLLDLDEGSASPGRRDVVGGCDRSLGIQTPRWRARGEWSPPRIQQLGLQLD